MELLFSFFMSDGKMEGLGEKLPTRISTSLVGSLSIWYLLSKEQSIPGTCWRSEISNPWDASVEEISTVLRDKVQKKWRQSVDERSTGSSLQLHDLAALVGMLSNNLTIVSLTIPISGKIVVGKLEGDLQSYTPIFVWLLTRHSTDYR